MLEDHLRKLREEDNINGAEDNENEEDAWKGWDVESDSSEESGSDGWMDVDSDGDNLEITDSEDEQGEVSKSGRKTTENGEGPGRVSTLATSKVPFISMQLLQPSHMIFLDPHAC